MHQDEQELLSAWEGWHWDDNKGGWLDLELCARREEVEYIRRHKMCVSPQRGVLTRNWKGPHQERMGGDGQGTTREAQRDREVGCQEIQDTRQTRTVCVDTAIGGAESRPV